ncbi:LacI family DNA-binding transcriptional regulator [Kordiimonas sp. SCSIO 12610]|uniref:LacI family DNA-binding transcriptional regulator n=1 Tax=Kordiimonas sp. SCSIO 12610 TaxID=2829597 RepID=UPI00210DDD5B|nr:LacI family DNA-binding transcriptional regulator [Kordiimonas sp. SCSIO 12610]UTW54706.1 LacI family DNA-binding transcriptional regulator [Kordiimonas sp. SCSIO 12610]
MANKPEKATIDDVARMAGVSVSTVSRVLNNEKYVREAMRKKVMDAVSMLRYKPSMHARSLAGEKSHVLGLFFDDPRGEYVSSILYGALKKCNEDNTHLAVEILDTQNAGEKIEAFLSQLRPDGVILPPPVCDNVEVLNILDRHKIPAVRIAPSFDHASMMTIKIDDKLAALDLIEHVIALGHTEIAIIKGDPEHGGAKDRLSGYRAALTKHGINIREEFLEQGYFSFDSGFACADRLLSLVNPPTAIFACNDEMASAVISCARQKGLKVPNDVSVVGFDDAVICTRVWPTITTVRQPVEEIAITAIEYLKNLQDPQANNAEGVGSILMDYSIIQRQSCIASG